MRDPDDLFAALATSRFRSRFRLRGAERDYLARRGLEVVLRHGTEFIRDRLAPARPDRDGKQTPFRSHPFFVAQHATATCCRSCLEKWHRIPRGRPLSEEEQRHVIAVAGRWLRAQEAHGETDRPDEPLRVQLELGVLDG